MYWRGTISDGQLQSQHEYNRQQYESTGQNKQETKKKRQKVNQFRLRTLRHEFLKNL
jgi:hypothetical protein